ELDQELLSRGLDADLDRTEMRRLYRLAVTQPQTLQEMAQLLGLERSFQEVSLREQQTFTNRSTVDVAVASMVAEKQRRHALINRIHRAWLWFFSPRSVVLQPFSFVGGVAAVILVLGLFPTISQKLAWPTMKMPDMAAVLPTAHRGIQEVQFKPTETRVNSQAERVNWTNRFIVPPGAATSLSLNNGGEDPVLLQFESVQPATLEVIHYAGGLSGERVQLLNIDGIGYATLFATLREPRQGDEVVVKNSGKVPVLVYMRSMDGATVSDLKNLQKDEATRQNL
ncbi:MAG TPA: hypothetical protein HPQ00_11825, partial [Magnetococcales bacterium]|nr:hypothetical protein [Magnetococcales bacterium]